MVVNKTLLSISLSTKQFFLFFPGYHFIAHLVQKRKIDGLAHEKRKMDNFVILDKKLSNKWTRSYPTNGQEAILTTIQLRL
jgi:hypothetical protein